MQTFRQLSLYKDVLSSDWAISDPETQAAGLGAETEAEGDARDEQHSGPGSGAATSGAVRVARAIERNDFEAAERAYEGCVKTDDEQAQSQTQTQNGTGSKGAEKPGRNLPGAQLDSARQELVRLIGRKRSPAYGATDSSHPVSSSPKRDESRSHTAEGDPSASAVTVDTEGRYTYANDGEDEEDELDEEDLALARALEMEMDALLRARARKELQDALGASLPDVPVVLCSLWRVDAALWNWGAGVSAVRYSILPALSFNERRSAHRIGSLLTV